MSTINEKELVFPYETIPPESIGNRELAREIGTQARNTIYLPFKSIDLREGFNCRVDYGDIESLAKSIMANGLDPITIDLLKSKKALVEIGHRRFKALQWINENIKGGVKSIEVRGIKNGAVECFVNNVRKTEEERILGQISSNFGKPYTFKETMRTVERLKDVFGYTNEHIAELIGGISRQTVDNMLLLAGSGNDYLLKEIDLGTFKPTVAVALSRISMFDEAINKPMIVEFINGFKGSGKTIKQTDVTEWSKEFQPKRDERKDKVKKRIEKGEHPIDANYNVAREESDSEKKFLNNNDEPKQWQESGDTITNENVGKIKGYVHVNPDDTAENNSHKTSAKTTIHEPKSSVAGEKKLQTVKDETAWCTDVLKNLDQIEVIVDKSKLPPQSKKDIENLLKWSAQKIETIKEFTIKAQLKD